MARCGVYQPLRWHNGTSQALYVLCRASSVASRTQVISELCALYGSSVYGRKTGDCEYYYVLSLVARWSTKYNWLQYELLCRNLHST